MEGVTYNINNLPKCQLSIKLEVQENTVTEEFNKIFEKVKKNAKMAGFRQGKVPLNIVKEKYVNEAKHELLSSYLTEVVTGVIKKEKINAVTIPKITECNVELGLPLKATIIVEVYPEIQPKKYKKMKFEKKEYPVDSKDVENTIKEFMENNAVLKPKEKPAASGDIVIVGIKAFLENKDVDLGLQKDNYIEIGKEFILPDFDQNIVGMKKGDEKKFKYCFPDDFYKEELRNKDVDFELTVKEVKEKQLPEKQAIAKSLGFDNEDMLYENIKEKLEKQANKSSEDELEEKIIEFLVEKHDFEIPEGLVDEEFNKKQKQMESYIKTRGGDPDKVDKTKIREKTEKELKAGIILAAIAREEKISLTDEDIKKEEEEILEILKKSGAKEGVKARDYVNENALLTKKILNFIKDNSKIKTVKINKNT